MKDFVTIDGQKHRFEANFNALGAALKALDMDTINGLVNLAQLRPSTFPVLFACCLNEGARLEKEEWSITAEEVGCLPGNVISEMMQVFVRQGSPDAAEEAPAKKG